MSEDKYYKIMTIRFKKEEDAELIKELEEHNTSKRQWLHDLYYYRPQLPTDLCSIKEVEKVMMLYRIPPKTREGILNNLRTNCKK